MGMRKTHLIESNVAKKHQLMKWYNGGVAD